MMDIQENWEKALHRTEIIRPRIQPLLTFADTPLPYIFLAESSVNHGDTVVRKGEVVVHKPSIILPSNIPQFEGFDSESAAGFDENFVANFFLVRGIRFPSFQYNNKVSSLDFREGKLKGAIEHYSHELTKAENVSTGLVIGPEDVWPFSVLIFICSQVLKSADKDIRSLLDEFRKNR